MTKYEIQRRLIGLIDELPPHEGKTFEEALADHLIANGVTFSECTRPLVKEEAK